MLIIRTKGAPRLNSTLSAGTGYSRLAQIVTFSKVITLIYFDNGIRTETIEKARIKAFRRINSLEAEDKEFIILVDKKCNTYQSRDALTVINADAVPYENLTQFYQDDEIKDRPKSQLFHDIFTEWLAHNISGDKTKTFEDGYGNFVRMALETEVITGEVLFVAMDTKTGKIYNGSRFIGDYLAQQKIWVFNEEYDHQENMNVDYNSINAFCSWFEEGHWVTRNQFRTFNKHELAEIIERYPSIFSDFLRGNGCFFKQSLSKEALDNYAEDDILEEIYDTEDNVLISTRMCYSCGDYFKERDMDEYYIDGRTRKVCSDCLSSVDDVVHQETKQVLDLTSAPWETEAGWNKDGF